MDLSNEEPPPGGSCSTSSDPEVGMPENAALEVAFSFSNSRKRPTKTGCMVSSCSTTLSSKYELRYRLCTTHMKAPQFLIAGELHRWCQKCGKFHALADFDGNRKSCRASLERHNDKQKKLRLRKQAAAVAAGCRPCGGSDGAEDSAPVEVPTTEDSAMASEASISPPPLAPTPFYTVEVTEVPMGPAPTGRLSPTSMHTPFSGPEGMWSDALAAAFPPLPPAPLCDEATGPQELDDFIADMLLEPSLAMEGLGGGGSEPAAFFLDAAELPPVLDLPMLV